MNITSSLIGRGTLRFRVVDAAGRPASRAAGVEQLRRSPTFRADLVASMARAPFAAFFWEMPATSRAHQDRELEWVLVDAPSLASVTADPSDFDDRFRTARGKDVLTFPNLGGDAMLVVPAPRADVAAYAHLAAFVRGAPAPQVDALFAALGDAIAARLGPTALWVSTAGLGVSWLHLRLDGRPKYYRHEPYKRVP